MTVLNGYLCFAMRGAMKKIERNFQNIIGSTGISVPQSFILLCLREDDGITLKEIGNQCLIDSSSMTVLVDKLERDGLVERRLDPQDRRAIRIFILAKGQEIADQVSKMADEFNVQLYDIVGEGNQKEFVHGIRNIVKSLP